MDSITPLTVVGVSNETVLVCIAVKQDGLISEYSFSQSTLEQVALLFTAYIHLSFCIECSSIQLKVHR